MKIVHISSSDSGGAGKAALRLHKALLSQDIDSRLLCLHKSEESPNVYQIDEPLWSKIIRHIPLPIAQNKYSGFIRRHGQNYECLSFPEAVYDISSHPILKDADIINLHWVGSMLNYPKFFRKTDTPIIWTLHDMNPFLGCAHYMGDKNKNIVLLNFEEKLQGKKTKAIKQHPNITVVNLCKWMMEYSSASEAFSDRRHVIIPNSVDTNIFCPRRKEYSREVLGIPNELPVLLFSAQAATYRKGIDFILESIPQIKRKCYYVMVGIPPKDLKKTTLHCLGSVKDELLMSIIYSAADALLLPSREDNLPNSMLEAICCGTPVISMPNGGMRDVINNMENGILAEDISVKSFTNAINTFLDRMEIFDSMHIAQESHKLYAPQVQANNYIKLYKSLSD